MTDKSRACYCASTLCMTCGMLIILAGLVILYMIAADKSAAGKKTNSPSASGQPASPTSTREGREIEGNFGNADESDLWYVLVMIIAGGLMITVLGFLCSNCAIICCSKRRNSISDSESKWAGCKCLNIVTDLFKTFIAPYFAPTLSSPNNL